jgi:hypothetical protein
MKSILFSKITTHENNDLTEQVFSLINSILLAKDQNKKVIILDSFKNENIPIPTSEVFELDILNNFLKEYDILVIDKTSIDYKINAVLYNQNNKVVDITDNVPNIIYPPQNVSQVFINYTINNKTISETYPSINLKTDINLYTFQNVDSKIKNDKLFDSILKVIDFKPYLKKGSDFDNIIHINDDVEKYAGDNIGEYKYNLDQTYIHLITEFMNKDESILLIGNSENQRVNDFLRDNQYKYDVDIVTDSFKEIELLHCTCKTFVGNFDLDNLKGNTYSYYLSKKIKCGKMIMIDLYNL